MSRFGLYGVRVVLRRWGRAPPGVARCPLGMGRCWSLRRGMPFLRVCPGTCRCVLLLCVTVPVPSPSWPMGGTLLPCCVAPGALSLWAPACYHGPFLAPLPGCPFPSLALHLPVPFSFPVWWRWGGGGSVGRRWPTPGGGWSGATGVGFWGVWGRQRPWTASWRRAPHAACGMAASGAARLGLAGLRMPISLKVCTMCTPYRLPAPPVHFTQRRSSRKAGADHQARWAAAWGGGGERSELKVLEGVVDMGRRWRAWRRLGERERRWRALGVEDAYGRRGEREAQ